VSFSTTPPLITTGICSSRLDLLQDIAGHCNEVGITPNFGDAHVRATQRLRSVDGCGLNRFERRSEPAAFGFDVDWVCFTGDIM